MSHFLFVKLVQQRRTQNHAKPAHRVCRSSGQPFTGTTRSAGVGGYWVSASDIGRVGKKRYWSKMVLRRIPIYFLSTIVHDLKPKLASSGEGIGWLAAGIIPNSLHRVPFVYPFSGRCILLLLLSFCRFCFVSLCFLLLSLELCICSSDLFPSSRPCTGLATTYITKHG